MREERSRGATPGSLLIGYRPRLYHATGATADLSYLAFTRAGFEPATSARENNR